jgi:hypothetical protein
LQRRKDITVDNEQRKQAAQEIHDRLNRQDKRRRRKERTRRAQHRADPVVFMASSRSAPVAAPTTPVREARRDNAPGVYGPFTAADFRAGT